MATTFVDESTPLARTQKNVKALQVVEVASGPVRADASYATRALDAFEDAVRQCLVIKSGVKIHQRRQGQVASLQL
jgi:hypothetical protein